MILPGHPIYILHSTITNSLGGSVTHKFEVHSKQDLKKLLRQLSTPQDCIDAIRKGHDVELSDNNGNSIKYHLESFEKAE